MVSLLTVEPSRSRCFSPSTSRSQSPSRINDQPPSPPPPAALSGKKRKVSELRCVIISPAVQEKCSEYTSSLRNTLWTTIGARMNPNRRPTDVENDSIVNIVWMVVSCVYVSKVTPTLRKEALHCRCYFEFELNIKHCSWRNKQINKKRAPDSCLILYWCVLNWTAAFDTESINNHIQNFGCISWEIRSLCDQFRESWSARSQRWGKYLFLKLRNTTKTSFQNVLRAFVACLSQNLSVCVGQGFSPPLPFPHTAKNLEYFQTLSSPLPILKLRDFWGIFFARFTCGKVSFGKFLLYVTLRL